MQPQAPLPPQIPEPIRPMTNEVDASKPILYGQIGPDPNISDDRKNERQGFRSIISTILLFVLAPLFALLMILFVFQSYVVDGSSMEPTLQNGNRVFILKLPKTISNLGNKTWLPTRGEIIVFKKPSDPSVQLIKRVIGLPGDRVLVTDGKIIVFNAEHPEGFNPDVDGDYAVSGSTTQGEVNIAVGENELFVVGDNRAPGGSLDSRNGVGIVPAENIIGRLWIRYFPLSEFQVYAISESVQRFALSHLRL